MRTWFPEATKYERFNRLMREVLKELIVYLFLCGLAKPSEANYIDSKKLPVCHIKREKQHRVFKGIAGKGKSSTGWFFGFKLHVLLNQWGELVNFRVSTGNVADNNASLLRQLFHNFQGWVFADRGYWTKIMKELQDKGVELIPKPKKNQAGLPISPQQKHYAKKRGIIESAFDM
ncbi:MAG: IS982 family transposase [Microscillaceae bacterium]|nr:IS982 family transposase [Microscillaceae bacterium]